MWPLRRVALALALGCLLSRSAEAQVYRLAELNIDQIRMLDRQRTVILLPGGVLEEPPGIGWGEPDRWKVWLSRGVPDP
jgi:hypothetical protein